MLNGHILGQPKSQSYMYDNRHVILNLSNLTERLRHIEDKAYYPLILADRFNGKYGIGMSSLPIVIRERDTEYQFHRVLLFKRLLRGYPFTRPRIVSEAKKDIPPLLRGEIWSCLLGVLKDNSYEGIDKITATPTDRQIEVDIPRCHQYDELLSSPEGHQKLKRLLKAWVRAHPHYVYWQGLDSLTAPFLYLNFNDEGESNALRCRAFGLRSFLIIFMFINRTRIPQPVRLHTEIFALVLPQRQFANHQGVSEQILAADRIP